MKEDKAPSDTEPVEDVEWDDQWDKPGEPLSPAPEITGPSFTRGPDGRLIAE